VKILRRPEGGVATGASSVEPSCTSNEHKTFAQREAEYASARARILGSGSKDSSLTREGSRNIKQNMPVQEQEYLVQDQKTVHSHERAAEILIFYAPVD
jgi:hypothetical protein